MADMESGLREFGAKLIGLEFQLLLFMVALGEGVVDHLLKLRV